MLAIQLNSVPLCVCAEMQLSKSCIASYTHMPPFGVPTRTTKISSSTVAASFNNAVEGREGTEDTQPLLPVEDFEESTWLYCKYSRSPTTRWDLVAEQLNSFKWESSWKRKVLRLASKMGVASLSLYEDDDQPVPTHSHDLSRIVNVKWIFVPHSECLSFSSENNVSDSFVFGQIAFRVDLVAPHLEQLYSELVNGGSGAAGGDAEVHHQAAVVPDILNHPRFPRHQLTTFTFAFSSNAEATAWYDWFAALITIKERMHVEMSEYEVPAPNPPVPVFRLTPQNSKFLKEFIRSFHHAPKKAGLGGARGVGGLFTAGDGPPADGKVRVKMPESGDFTPYYMTSTTSTGEVYFATKKPNLLMSHVKFDKRLKLIDQCLIQATTAFGTEFVIDLNPQLASGEGATSTVVGYGGGIGVGGAKQLVHSRSTWWFLCKTVKQRNQFIEWLRMVKGRGDMTQTEEETYPFMASAATPDTDESANVFEAAHLRLSRSATMISPHSQQEEDDRDYAAASNMWHSAGQDVASLPRRKVGFGDVVASEVDDERKRREAEEYLALFPSHEPSSASSTDSVSSTGRRFQHFPTYDVVTVQSYVDSCVSVHMDGRPIKTLQKVMGHAWVNRQTTLLTASSGSPSGIGGRGALHSRSGTGSGTAGGNGNLMALIAANRVRQRAVSVGAGDTRLSHASPRPTPRMAKRSPPSSVKHTAFMETGANTREVGAEAVEPLTGLARVGHFSNVLTTTYGARVRREAAAGTKGPSHFISYRRPTQ